MRRGGRDELASRLAPMILIVAGVSGSGKTTVGKLIAERLTWLFADGDDFHSAANVAKMKSGVPLTDADRQPWLAALGTWLDGRLADGTSAVLACSALKRRYRQLLLAGRAAVEMAFLEVSWPDCDARMLVRQGHFFAEALLASQFAELEVPENEDRVHVVRSDRRPASVVADEIISWLGGAWVGT